MSRPYQFYLSGFSPCEVVGLQVGLSPDDASLLWMYLTKSDLLTDKGVSEARQIALSMNSNELVYFSLEVQKLLTFDRLYRDLGYPSDFHPPKAMKHATR